MTSVTTTELPVESRQFDRAYAALAGLAIGDALGMPTQALTREDIVKGFGSLLTDFQPSSPTHPFAAGLAAATVTDDTEQALILADVLVHTVGDFDARAYARRLLEWEDDVRRRGLLDLLGPSTKRALLNIDQGMDLSLSGRTGTTNGAAMRVAPVGIVWSSDDLEALVALVAQVSAPTHNTAVAISAAAAVAAVVSAGIDGATSDDAIATGLRAALIAERYGEPTSGASVHDQILVALAAGHGLRGVELIAAIHRSVGTGLESKESVPAAFALLGAYGADTWGACCAAASLGGDCDTIGAMAGAMAGACAGLTSLPVAAIARVERVNSLELAMVARRLLTVRR